MANNLKKFATVADYNAATLNYPAVSWVTATDGIYYDKSAPANDKVMIAWHTPSDARDGEDIVLFNGASSDAGDKISSVTINDVEVNPIAAVWENQSVHNTDYVVKYGLQDTTTIFDAFTGDLGGGWGSEAQPIDFLVPAQITTVGSLPSNVGNLVFETTTPPTVLFGFSALSLDGIYVPDNVVNTYKATWMESENIIYPISDYDGVLPV